MAVVNNIHEIVRSLPRDAFYEKVVKGGVLSSDQFSYAMSLGVDAMNEPDKNALKNMIVSVGVPKECVETDAKLRDTAHAISARAMGLS